MAGSSPDRQTPFPPTSSLLPQALLFLYIQLRCAFSPSRLSDLCLNITALPYILFIMGAHSAVWQGMNDFYTSNSYSTLLTFHLQYIRLRRLQVHAHTLSTLRCPSSYPYTLTRDLNGPQRTSTDRNGPMHQHPPVPRVHYADNLLLIASWARVNSTRPVSSPLTSLVSRPPPPASL
jgi:hypothetical protein